MNQPDLTMRLKKVGTAALSDALDGLGIEGQLLGITPVMRTMRFAAPAFTVRMLPVGQSKSTVGDYIDDVQRGQVVVIDNDGRMDATVWGDILTWVASEKGIAGTVIDGVCRDSDRCVELGYPVFARGGTMRTGKERVTADAYNVTIQVAGVRIAAGDWLAGDADGVVAIPAASVNQVLQIAEEIEVVEDRIRDAVKGGKRLDEARREFGYHALQSRAEKSG